MRRIDARDDSVLLGRGGGLLLVALGLVSVLLLFHTTGGHRARQAAEILGVLVGGGLTLVVVGVRRPSPQIVTRAFSSLGMYARVLFVVGLVLLFGFGLLTAGIAEVMPRLRDIPGFGGLVTLDWVVSLTILGTAGSMLLFLGVLAFRATSTPNNATAPLMADDAILERLWSASNGTRSDALRRCFGTHEESERLYGAWRDAIGPLGGTQVLLVSSSTVWDKTMSEWHVRIERGAATEIRQYVLLSRLEAGVIVSGNLFSLIEPEESRRNELTTGHSSSHLAVSPEAR